MFGFIGRQGSVETTALVKSGLNLSIAKEKTCRLLMGFDRVKCVGRYLNYCDSCECLGI